MRVSARSSHSPRNSPQCRARCRRLRRAACWWKCAPHCSWRLGVDNIVLNSTAAISGCSETGDIVRSGCTFPAKPAFRWNWCPPTPGPLPLLAGDSGWSGDGKGQAQLWSGEPARAPPAFGQAWSGWWLQVPCGLLLLQITAEQVVYIREMPHASQLKSIRPGVTARAGMPCGSTQ